MDLVRLVQLNYYHQMLTKHINLVERRLIKGEKIPHSEKVFSIFLPWTELIKKGKRNPSVEFGKSLSITAYNLHKIGRELLRQRRSQAQCQKTA